MSTFNVHEWNRKRRLFEAQRINEATIDDLLQQIEDMAFRGEIGSGEEGIMTRDELAHEVMKAVRRGRSKSDRSQPDYADRMAARKEKTAATKAADAERSKEMRAQFAAQRQADAAEMQARQDNNQLPLRYDIAFTDIENRIGSLASYYNKVAAGTDNAALILKPEYRDRSFSDEVIAKAWLK